MPSAGLGQHYRDGLALTTVERDFFRGLNTFAKTPERIHIDLILPVFLQLSVLYRFLLIRITAL